LSLVASIQTSNQRSCAIGCTLVVLLMLQLGLACGAAAQDAALPEDTLAHATVPQDPNAGPYFYRGLPYGSEAYMGPLDVLLNKGFALAQTETLSRKVFEYPYGLESALRRGSLSIAQMAWT